MTRLDAMSIAASVLDTTDQAVKMITVLERLNLVKFDTKEMPVFEHHHAGRHFKIYKNGAVDVSVSNLGYDSNFVINRLDKIK